MIRVHRVPFSTNVDRIALAARLKEIDVDWVDHPWDDRSGIVALSGQELAPVLELPDGSALADSPDILRWIDREYPRAPLWPADPALRARVDIFVEWFNGVWKGPPNRLADHGDDPAAAAQLAGWSATFDGLLSDGEFLVGDGLTAADVVAYPFLAYGAQAPEPADTHPFHHVLHRYCAPGPEHPRYAAWLQRMAAL